MTDSAIYVYCVVEAASRSRAAPTSPKSPALSLPKRSKGPDGLPGAGRPSCLDLGGGLWAVISEAPLSRYGPAQIESGLRNLEWVAEIAVAHEAVVEYHASRRGATVVPMKLFTLFTSSARAITELRAQRSTLTSALGRVRGCDEWGVRLVRSSRAPVAAVRPSPRKDGSGAAFLAAKKHARDAARDAVRQLTQAVESAFDLLAPLSRDSRRRTDFPDAASSPPLLDAAFLVPADRKATFRAAAKRAASTCRAVGIELTLSGPWPAYNFVQPSGQSAP
jgi:hypothetical protein